MSRFYYDDVLPCVIPQLILCGPGVCQHYMTFVAQPVARVLLLYIYIYIFVIKLKCSISILNFCFCFMNCGSIFKGMLHVHFVCRLMSSLVYVWQYDDLECIPIALHMTVALTSLERERKREVTGVFSFNIYFHTILN